MADVRWRRAFSRFRDEEIPTSVLTRHRPVGWADGVWDRVVRGRWPSWSWWATMIACVGLLYMLGWLDNNNMLGWLDK